MNGPVLQLVTRLSRSGVPREVLSLSDALRLEGWAVEVVAGVAGRGEGSLDDAGATILPHLRRGIGVHDVPAAVEVARQVRHRRPVVLNTHQTKAGALGRVAGLLQRVPVVVHTFHGHVLDGYFPRSLSAGMRLLERSLAARATDALVAVSTAVRDELISLGVGRTGLWRVIPPGIDLTSPLRSRISPDDARRRLGLPVGAPVVGSVGRLEDVKDIGTFLRAAARVTAVRPEAVFVIAGDGGRRPDLEMRAGELVPGRVRFLGWVEDLDPLYGALDVVVLTSRREGVPNVLIEAAASGTPVVSTRVGGAADVVREGRSGFLVDPGDAAAVADRVLRVLADPDAAASMGAEGRMWVAEHFDARRTAARTAELYQELLDGGVSRRSSPAPRRGGVRSS